MKRELREDERKFTEKNLKNLNQELEYLEKVELARKILAIDTAQIVVKKQVADLEVEKKVLTRKIEELKSIINSTQKILDEGVEVQQNIKKTKGGKK
jgi:hypothetical protein